MTTLMQDTAHEKRAMSSQVEAAGRELARYGLVVVVGWIGLMKFTAYEARRDSPVCRQQPADELGVRAHERPGLLGPARRRRGRHSHSHRHPSVVGAGFRAGQRPGGGDVPHDPELPRHDAGRLGAESRWLPRPVGGPGAVPHQGSGPTRDFALDAWRGLASERAKGMMRGIRIHQIEAVTVHC